MGTTTVGLSVVAANMTGSAIPSHIAVGIGSTAYVSGNTILVSEFDRNQIDTYDTSTAQKVIMIANWAPNDISGCIMKEYGVMTAGSQMVNREVLTGSLVFDGEQELQIQQTFQIKI